MQRIKAADSASAMPAAKDNAYSPGYFQDGNAARGEKGTQVSASWANGVQEELMHIIESARITPDINDNTQVLRALRIIMGEFCYPVGSYYTSSRPTDPGTLFGGTWERVQGCFVLASSDKYPAGSVGGAATVTLSAVEMPPHSHSASMEEAGGHTHAASSVSAGAHSHTGSIEAVGNHTHGASASGEGSHTHTRGTMEITGGLNGPAGSDDGPLAAPGTPWGAFNCWRNGGNGADGNSADDGGGACSFDFYASRSWTGATSAAGYHGHTISIGNAGGHTHALTVNQAGGHSHGITVNAGGSHTHKVSTGLTGSGKAHENMPPYVCAYIWRRIA